MAGAGGRRLAELGEDIRRRFARPLAETSSDEHWSEGHTLELRFPAPVEVNEWVIEEDLRFGQRVRRYRLETRRNERWKALAEGESIGGS